MSDSPEFAQEPAATACGQSARVAPGGYCSGSSSRVVTLHTKKKHKEKKRLCWGLCGVKLFPFHGAFGSKEVEMLRLNAGLRLATFLGALVLCAGSSRAPISAGRFPLH